MERLAREVHDWLHGRQIREYCKAMSQKGVGTHANASGQIDQWIRWSLAHADAIDPLLLEACRGAGPAVWERERERGRLMRASPDSSHPGAVALMWSGRRAGSQVPPAVHMRDFGGSSRPIHGARRRFCRRQAARDWTPAVS